MRTLILAISAAVLAACTTSSVPTSQSAEDFMWGYTKAWNAHDTDTLGREYWQLTDSVETEIARLEATFEQMTAAGYERSTIHEILACAAGDDMAVAQMRYTLYLSSGEVMGPEMRATNYLLDWEDERGWRIRGVFPADVDAPPACDLTLLPEKEA